MWCIAPQPIFLRSYSAVFNYTYHMASLSGGPKPWHVRYRWSNKPRYQYMGYFAYNFAWLAIAILAYYLSYVGGRSHRHCARPHSHTLRVAAGQRGQNRLRSPVHATTLCCPSM